MPSSRSYPDRPFVGVSAIICHDQHVVLVERAHDPMKGIWSLPGGAVEIGERLEAAIARELREEIELDLFPTQISELVEVLRFDEADKCERHFVIAVFITELSAGEPRPLLRAGDDAGKAEWVLLDDLARYPLTTGTLDVIRRGMKGTILPLNTNERAVHPVD